MEINYTVVSRYYSRAEEVMLPWVTYCGCTDLCLAETIAEALWRKYDGLTRHEVAIIDKDGWKIRSFFNKELHGG